VRVGVQVTTLADAASVRKTLFSEKPEIMGMFMQSAKDVTSRQLEAPSTTATSTAVVAGAEQPTPQQLQEQMQAQMLLQQQLVRAASPLLHPCARRVPCQAGCRCTRS
jgi:hypothetical protein